MRLSDPLERGRRIRSGTQWVRAQAGQDGVDLRGVDELTRRRATQVGAELGPFDTHPHLTNRQAHRHG
ncbi:Uncharacterised protein [Mycobacteroides abscessus subsp. abscessus]|nr:Uncharacterised protein [Mycobacteroides abscessus subsp. abscessus]